MRRGAILGIGSSAVDDPAVGGAVHAPPGAPGWDLVPSTMAWFGKSSSEICNQAKMMCRYATQNHLFLANRTAIHSAKPT